MDRKLKLVVNNTVKADTEKTLNPLKNSSTASRIVSPGKLVEEYIDEAFDDIDAANSAPENAMQLLLSAEQKLLKAKLINGNINVGDTAVINVKLGEVYLSLGNYDKSIDCFTIATEIISFSKKQLHEKDLADMEFLIFYNIGVAYYEKGSRDLKNADEHWDKAFNNFESALRLAPLCNNDDRQNNLLGEAYQNLGFITLLKTDENVFGVDYEKKIKQIRNYFENAVTNDPQLIISLVALSSIETELGNTKKGNEYFEKAMDIDIESAFELSPHFTTVVKDMFIKKKYNEYLE